MSRTTSDKKPRALGILNGSGGMAIGFENAGFELLGSLEADGDYGAAFRLNRPGLIHATALDQWDDSIQAAMKAGEIDVVFGHPPCQGVSGINASAGADAKKNRMMVEFVLAALKIQPKYAVFENIPRMLSLGKETVTEARKLAEDAGYTFKIHRHDAQHFGVCQVRRRVMFTMERKDVVDWWPSEPRMRAPTFWEINSDLALVEPFGADPEEQFKETRVIPYACDPMNDYQSAIRRGSPGVMNHKLIEVPGRYQHIKPGHAWMSMPREHMSEVDIKRIEENRLFNAVEMVRVHPDRVCRVLTGARNKMHPTLVRHISVREGARLMGFPDHWKWPSSGNFQQIAAGVCPPVAQWFGEVIMARESGAEHVAPDGRLF